MTPVTGGPDDVKAPACRTLFVNDDPATYLNGGARIARDAAGNGNFTGLFRPNATGVVFGDGTLEFFRSNGDMVITHRLLDSTGKTLSFDQFVARDVGGTLKIVGNQYAYPAGVRAATQERDFINTPQFTYYNVGYDISIANLTDSNGAPIFSQVVVTAPDNAIYTMVPTAGNNGLRLKKADGTVTGTSIIRLNGAYRNPSTAGSPVTLETQLVYVSPLLTDAQIGAIPDQAVWKLEFFHVDTTKPNVIQSYRTMTRAYTLAEASQVTFARLTPTMRTFLQGLTSANGRFTYTTPPNAATPNVIAFGTPTVDAWEVPPLAAAPIAFSAFGSAPTVNGVPGSAFDDGVTLSSAARTAFVTCTKATNTDAHCDTSTGVTQYALGTTWNYVQLRAGTKHGMDIYSGIAMYKY